MGRIIEFEDVQEAEERLNFLKKELDKSNKKLNASNYAIEQATAYHDKLTSDHNHYLAGETCSDSEYKQTLKEFELSKKRLERLEQKHNYIFFVHGNNQNLVEKQTERLGYIEDRFFQEEVDAINDENPFD